MIVPFRGSPKFQLYGIILPMNRAESRTFEFLLFFQEEYTETPVLANGLAGG